MLKTHHHEWLLSVVLHDRDRQKAWLRVTCGLLKRRSGVRFLAVLALSVHRDPWHHHIRLFLASSSGLPSAFGATARELVSEQARDFALKGLSFAAGEKTHAQ